MSKYFNSWATDEEIIHYGVKGMKWRKRKAREVSTQTTYGNRPRARRRFVTEGNGDGVWKADEKTSPHDPSKRPANSGLPIDQRLDLVKKNARQHVQNKKKRTKGRKQALARIKAVLA